MKTLSRKFEDIMAAIAFAEAGEFETAGQLLHEQRDDVSGLVKKKPELNILAPGV